MPGHYAAERHFTPLFAAIFAMLAAATLFRHFHLIIFIAFLHQIDHRFIFSSIIFILRQLSFSPAFFRRRPLALPFASRAVFAFRR